MATLEKRLEALEQRAGNADARIVVLYKDTDVVPDGFKGKVVRVVFVEPKSDLEVPHAHS